MNLKKVSLFGLLFCFLITNIALSDETKIPEKNIPENLKGQTVDERLDFLINWAKEVFPQLQNKGEHKLAEEIEAFEQGCEAMKSDLSPEILAESAKNTRENKTGQYLYIHLPKVTEALAKQTSEEIQYSETNSTYDGNGEEKSQKETDKKTKTETPSDNVNKPTKNSKKSGFITTIILILLILAVLLIGGYILIDIYREKQSKKTEHKRHSDNVVSPPINNTKKKNKIRRRQDKDFNLSFYISKTLLPRDKRPLDEDDDQSVYDALSKYINELKDEKLQKEKKIKSLLAPHSPQKEAPKQEEQEKKSEEAFELNSATATNTFSTESSGLSKKYNHALTGSRSERKQFIQGAIVCSMANMSAIIIEKKNEAPVFTADPSRAGQFWIMNQESGNAAEMVVSMSIRTDTKQTIEILSPAFEVKTNSNLGQNVKMLKAAKVKQEGNQWILVEKGVVELKM